MPPLEAAPDFGCGLFFSSLIPSRLIPDSAADHVSRREYACGIGEVARREVLNMKDKDKDKDRFSIEEEAEWRIQVLKRTARISAAKAKQLERERNAMRRKEPLEDREGLEGTLRCIDNVMEWRFVDEFGRVELDADMLSMHITVRELRFIRACVVRAIEELEGGAR